MPESKRKSPVTREPFDTWQRGGSTHWSECWKGHLICALQYATAMLGDCMEILTEDDRDEFADVREFIAYIEKNR